MDEGYISLHGSKCYLKPGPYIKTCSHLSHWSFFMHFVKYWCIEHKGMWHLLLTWVCGLRLVSIYEWQSSKIIKRNGCTRPLFWAFYKHDPTYSSQLTLTLLFSPFFKCNNRDVTSRVTQLINSRICVPNDIAYVFFLDTHSPKLQQNRLRRK